MLLALLFRPAPLLILAWLGAVWICLAVTRKLADQEWNPTFQDPSTRKWLAPFPQSLRFHPWNQRSKPRFVLDLLASYSAARAVHFAQALHSIRK
jgi:hypothetical protein